MPSEFDRQFDEMLARVTGPGGRLVIERDAEGRAIVGNFPATLPGLFKAFCELYGDSREALVSGDERLTFADLDRHSDAVARALAGRRHRQGRARRHRDAQLPELGRRLHGGGQGRGGRRADQRLVAEA